MTHRCIYTPENISSDQNTMTTVITVASIIALAGISFTAIVYMLTHRVEYTTAPVSQLVSQEREENTVPFSYNIPVDSHMNYKNDVVIVVEHPDEKISVGVR